MWLYSRYSELKGADMSIIGGPDMYYAILVLGSFWDTSSARQCVSLLVSQSLLVRRSTTEPIPEPDASGRPCGFLLVLPSGTRLRRGAGEIACRLHDFF